MCIRDSDRPSRSMRSLTIASNMKQSFGHGEKPSERAIVGSELRIRTLGVSRTEQFQRHASEVFDCAGEVPGSAVPAFNTVRYCAHLRERNARDEAGVHERRAFHRLDIRCVARLD